MASKHKPEKVTDGVAVMFYLSTETDRKVTLLARQEGRSKSSTLRRIIENAMAQPA